MRRLLCREGNPAEFPMEDYVMMVRTLNPEFRAGHKDQKELMEIVFHYLRKLLTVQYCNWHFLSNVRPKLTNHVSISIQYFPKVSNMSPKSDMMIFLRFYAKRQLLRQAWWTTTRSWKMSQKAQVQTLTHLLTYSQFSIQIQNGSPNSESKNSKFFISRFSFFVAWYSNSNDYGFRIHRIIVPMSGRCTNSCSLPKYSWESEEY